MHPGETVSKYELVRKLGQGGLGEVWEARDASLGRQVAMKFILGARAMDPQERGRLLKEARAAAKVAHPGIVIVHDVSVHDEPPFLVMELLAGPSLAQRLTAGPLEAGEAVRLAAQVSRALDHAHRHAGLVHRDVKPANLVFDAHGLVKLCDFGIVRFHEAVTRATLTSHGMGTPHYAAPEQWAEEAVDGRADLYALGCVLFEMLTGRPPFEGPSNFAVIIKHARDAPARPGALRPGIPAALDQLVLHLLAKKPADRPASATEVTRRLEWISLTLPASAARQATATDRAGTKDEPADRRARRARYIRPPWPQRPGLLRPLRGDELEWLGLRQPVPMPGWRELHQEASHRHIAATLEMIYTTTPRIATSPAGTLVRAMDARSGAVSWEASFPLARTADLALSNDSLLVFPTSLMNPGRAHVACLSRHDGGVQWTGELPRPPGSRPYDWPPVTGYAATGEIAIAEANADASITGWDIATGNRRFVVPTEGKTGQNSFQALPNGSFMRTGKDSTTVYDPENGDVTWHYPEHGMPRAAGNWVFAPYGRDHIAVLDARDGTRLDVIPLDPAGYVRVLGTHMGQVIAVAGGGSSAGRPARLVCASPSGQQVWHRPWGDGHSACLPADRHLVLFQKNFLRIRSGKDGAVAIAGLDADTGDVTWAAAAEDVAGAFDLKVAEAGGLIFWLLDHKWIIEIDPGAVPG